MTPADAVAYLAARPQATGLVLDFDGTLAPIVADPTRSGLPAATAQTLAWLSKRLGAVAIVSGRPASYLAEQVAIPGVRLFGLYGLETADAGGRVEARPQAEAWRDAVGAARERLREATADVEGVWLEDKGLSVAVHWRNATDREAAGARVERLVESVAADLGLAREPGKFVEELRPPVEWDKGAAVRALVDDAGLDRVGYAGDDRGDLPGLRTARDAGGVAIVVDHGEETHPEVRQAADVVVDGVEDFAQLLAQLAEAMGGSPPG